MSRVPWGEKDREDWSQTEEQKLFEMVVRMRSSTLREELEHRKGGNCCSEEAEGLHSTRQPTALGANRNPLRPPVVAAGGCASVVEDCRKYSALMVSEAAAARPGESSRETQGSQLAAVSCSNRYAG